MLATLKPETCSNGDKSEKQGWYIHSLDVWGTLNGSPTKETTNARCC
jgi:hypothetical protein